MDHQTVPCDNRTYRFAFLAIAFSPTSGSTRERDHGVIKFLQTKLRASESEAQQARVSLDEAQTALDRERGERRNNEKKAEHAEQALINSQVASKEAEK